MFQFYTCLTRDHDSRLVVLAAVVCVLSSAAAIGLFHRAQAAAGRSRIVWISVGAVAGGCGVWATHFIAMLAYAPALGGRYGFTLTVLSLLIAALFSLAGFGIALLANARAVAAIGGAVIGLGIAAMHYTGMHALEYSQFIVWNPSFVAASVVFGVIFGSLAISIAVRKDTWLNSAAAAGLLTIAIVSMHFTSMAGIEFMPDLASLPGTAVLSPTLFSLFVACIVSLILAVCLFASLSDKRWKGTLQQQKMLLDTALENMSQGLAMFDASGRVTLHNTRYAHMTGLPEKSYYGRTLLELLRQRKLTGHFFDDPEKHFDHVTSTMRDGKTNTRHVKVADRTLRIVEVPMKGGGWTATFEDVTEWLVTQARISHLAHHDSLTDLVNRTQLVADLEYALSASRLAGTRLALHFIDVDRFKTVNDSMGHDGGDLVLKTLADRLRALTGPADIVARLGGDEFIVVQASVNDKNDAESFAKRIAAVIVKPIDIGSQSVVVTGSIGVAMAPEDATTPERLLKCADLSMYKSKSDGRNCIRFFTPDLDEELNARTALERAIRHAIENDGFELHYQPLIAMGDRKITGFEALVRMKGEGGKLIPPMEFIPIAEELRLIDRIGAWVLHEACRSAVTWPDSMTIAVNLSPLQFLNGDIASVVESALNSSGLAPQRLELEITESLLLGDTTAILDQLHKLKARGISIVMDDFGTGYSSLSYLWKFPFDKIKLDRSFLKGSGNAGRDAATVVKTIVALGRELKMRVTVEGIESESQAAFIEDVESDQGQGYYFGRPMPASDIPALILGELRADIEARSKAAAKRKTRIAAAPGRAIG